MSLRDAFLAKGLASKAQVSKAQRELKTERKEDNAHKVRAHVAAKAAAEVSTRLAEEKRVAARDVRDRVAEERARTELALRIRQLVGAHRVKVVAGPHRFCFVDADGKTVQRMNLTEAAVYQLRCGELAVVSAGSGRFEIVARIAALRLRELSPALIRHFVEDTTGISAPELSFQVETQELSFRARRATPEDIERFRRLASKTA